MTKRSSQLQAIRDFFTPPALEDEEKARAASLASAMLNILLAGTVSGAIALTAAGGMAFISDPANLFIMGGVLIVSLLLRFGLRRGVVQPVGLVLSAEMLAVITFIAYAFGGLQNPLLSGGYLLCIIIAGLLLGEGGALGFTLLSIMAIGSVYLAHQNKPIPPPGEAPPTFYLVAYSSIFGMGGLLLRYAASNVSRALERARRNEQAQREANRELQALRASLEQQVAERTAALERRSAYLAASVQVGQAIASILETETLLQQVVELINQSFGLYHVGLFLRDASGQWAELRAATGKAGKLLREQKFRLQIDENSMIGWCMENAQTRLANDVRQVRRVHHPLLGATRSEIALPLIARGRVIGGLSAQSERPNAFDPDAVAALQTIADQVAVAIDNARLFAETQAALEAERRAYGQVSRQAWRDTLRALKLAGYSYLNKTVAPLEQATSLEQDTNGPTLSLPITVRGAVIGAVDLHKEAGSDWTREEVTLLQTLVDQVGLALDSARLYQDTQRRAAQEKLVSDITAHIRQSLEIDHVLQTAARELGEALQAARVNVRLVTSDEDN